MDEMIQDIQKKRRRVKVGIDFDGHVGNGGVWYS